MFQLSTVIVAASLLIVPLTANPVPAQDQAKPSIAQKDIEAKTLGLPVQFEENRGQFDSSVQYFSLGLGHRFLVRGSEMEFVFGAGRKNAQSVTMRLLGANHPKGVGATDRLSGVSNYYSGNDPKLWLKGSPRFGRVRVAEVYPGIDVEYYGQGGLLEYDFVLRPGADPGTIRMVFQGARSIRTGTEGDLLIGLDGGVLRQRKPLVYQLRNGKRTEVASRYIKKADGAIGVKVAAYDRTQPLIVDPVLEYSSYLRNAGFNGPFLAQVSADGSTTVVAGFYNFASAYLDEVFVTRTIPNAKYGSDDVLLYRIAPNGKDILFSTVFAGTGFESPESLCLMADGGLAVGGYTYSADLPVSGGPQAVSGGGESDGFVVRLDSLGGMLWATYLGGSGIDYVHGIAADAAGSVVAVGSTNSNNFPVVSAYQANRRAANYTAFVSKINSVGAFVFSTYLGGNQGEAASAVAMDSGGSVVVAGSTQSADFPSTPGTVQPNTGTGGDAFITKLGPTGSLTFSTYLGGSASDSATSVVLDVSANIYVGGETASSNFPLAQAAQTTFGGQTDGFLTKLNSTATSLLYSTYLGGSRSDKVSSVAVDTAGSAAAAGLTSSSDYPVAQAIQAAKVGLSREVWASPDGGASWNPGQSGLPPGVSGTLLRDAIDPLRWYLWDGSSSLFSTADGGSTWTTRSSGQQFYGLTAHPTVAGLLFGIVYDSLSGQYRPYRSLDYGVNWTLIAATGLPQGGLNFIVAADPQTAQTYYLAANQSVYKSSNGGASWSSVVTLTATIFDVGVSFGLPQVLLAATSQGVYRSTDGGTTWNPPPAGFNTVYRWVRFGRSSNSTVYAGYSSVYRSLDGGATWQLRSTIGTPVPVVDDSSVDVLYAATDDGLKRSVDGGINWTVFAFNRTGLRGVLNSGTRLMVTGQVTGDLFVTKLAPNGSISWSTFLGGRGADSVSGVQYHGSGSVAVFGMAGTGLTVTSDAAYSQPDGLPAFVARISAANPGCSYTLTPSSRVISSSAGTYTLQVAAPSGCAWTVNSSESWITLDPTVSGTGAGSVYYSVSANSGGTRTVTFTAGGAVTTVSQQSSACTFQQSPATILIGQEGGSFNVSLTGPAGCPWLASASARAMAASPLSGTGPGNITVTVSRNLNNAPRTLYLNVGGRSVQVDQAGLIARPSLTLSVPAPSPTLGQAVTLSASINPPAATGKITFFDSGTPLGVASLAGGQASLSVLLPSGRRNIGARYSGDGTYASSSIYYSSLNVQTTTVLSILPPVTTAVGSLPVSVATGDFNRDGKQDLVVANSGSSTVSILMGNGNGTFQAAVNYGVGLGPSSVAVGDFNLDGRLDLVVANSGSGGVSVLLGNSNGTFQAASNLATGTAPAAVVVADVEGDGKLDIAVVNAGSNTLAILSGNGNGTFTAPQTYPTGATPSGLAVTDLDKDFRPDFVVANYDSSTLNLYRGGAYASQIVVPTGPNPRGVAIGYFDTDDIPDVVVTSEPTGWISVHKGNYLTLGTPVNYVASGAVRSVAIGDLDGDEYLDIVAGSPTSNTVAVFTNKGDGTFQRKWLPRPTNSPDAVVVGDFNNDGRSDLVTANQGTGSISMLAGSAQPGGADLGSPTWYPGVFRSGLWFADTSGSNGWEPTDQWYSFGMAGDRPLFGFWNPDSRAELLKQIGVFRNGFWFVDYSGDDAWGAGDTYFLFGLAGDIPVVGDWDGSGQDKIGIFRNGIWYLDYNGNRIWDAGDRWYVFGAAGDIPVVNKWDGAGADKIGVFRNGSWFVDYNGNSTWDANDRWYLYGIAGDKPVLGDWAASGESRLRLGLFRQGVWFLDVNGSNAWEGSPGDSYFAHGLPDDDPAPNVWKLMPPGVMPPSSGTVRRLMVPINTEFISGAGVTGNPLPDVLADPQVQQRLQASSAAMDAAVAQSPGVRERKRKADQEMEAIANSEEIRRSRTQEGKARESSVRERSKE